MVHMAKDSSKKEITINELARMGARGFSDMAERFDRLEYRMDALEKRMDALEKRMDALEKRMDALEESGRSLRSEMCQRFDKIDSEIKEVKVRLDRLEKKTRDDDDALVDIAIKHEKRISSLERKFLELRAR